MRVHASLAAVLGRFLNALGAPGFVRSGSYESRQTGARVQVYCGELFTVVSINGTEVYFDRLHGRIDGVGSGRIADRPHFQHE
jgi:hypothetical protein